MASTSGAELFERHHLAIFRFLRRMVGQEGPAEDLTQEVFLRALRALASYREQDQGRAWLFRIARNVLADRHREAARTPGMATLDELPEAAAASSPTPTLALALEQAFGRLPDHERTAFMLREVGGLGYSEIATLTDATPDAVRSRIHRARLSLRRILTEPLAEARSRVGKETAS